MAGKRRIRRKTVVLTVIALFILAATASFIYIKEKYKITEVIITGSDKYTYEQLYKYVFENRNDSNLLLFKYTNSRAPKPEIPFISKVDYVTKAPGTIEVTVYEKSIVGYVEYKGTNMYFDKDGMVVESSTEVFDDAVKVEGLEFRSIVVYEKLQVPDEKVFAVLNDLTQYLGKYGIKVDTIGVDGDNSLSVTIGEVLVLLGQSDAALADKVYELGCMAEKLAGLKGTLYLDKFDGNQSNIIFKEG